MLKRLALLALGSVIITMLFAGVAIAGWTPQDIYDDFAKNGKLTRDYTPAEMRAYLNDASLAQYGSKDIKDPLDHVVVDLLNQDRDTFPFTGFQLMIAGIVVVVLIGGGLALRHFSRPQRPRNI